MIKEVITENNKYNLLLDFFFTGMSRSIITKRNKTKTAPTYTKTKTIAKNSAFYVIHKIALLKNIRTKRSAA